MKIKAPGLRQVFFLHRKVENEMISPGTAKVLQMIVQTVSKSKTLRYLVIGLIIIVSTVVVTITGFFFSFSCILGDTQIPSDYDGTVEQIGKYPMPCKGAIIRNFGGKNRGIDIQPSWHTPVSAIADGFVYDVETTKSENGNYVLIMHTLPNGSAFFSYYGYLSKVFVSFGQTVKAKDVIGLEGGDPKRDDNPGSSTEHHLHFEIWLSSIPQGFTDPRPYIL